MKVLIVAAHPDDEALGCGGAMIKHADRGDEISLLFMTDGVGSRDEAEEEDARQRSAAMESAAGILGVGNLDRLNFPDNALDTVPLLKVAKGIEAAVEKWGTPDLVYTHHPGDLNIDHVLVHRAALTCFRPQPGSCVGEIRTFEVPSSTGWNGSAQGGEFVPNIYEDISGVLERKMQALHAYGLEMREWPHARSYEAVEALAKYRGSQVGLAAAEAFGLERKVVG